MRILFDITGCALGGGSTGIPRMCRELLSALRRRKGIRAEPILWESVLDGYAHLGLPHRLNLLSARKQSVTLWERKWRSWTRHRRVLPSSAFDVCAWLVLAEVFSDRRIEWLETVRQAHPMLRIAAIFYDAVALTHPHWIPERNRVRFPAYARSLARCHRVWCISRESQGDLLAFWKAEGLTPAPTSVLHCPLTGLFDTRQSLPGGPTPGILCVGSFEPRKNHLLLLRSCEALWEKEIRFSLQLAGQGSWDGSDEVLAEIRRLQEKGRPIVWIPNPGDQALRRLYRACTFTVYPSLKEGFGLPILESLACGKPCLCGDSGAVAEAATGGGALAIDVRDESAFTDGLRRLLEDTALRQTLADEARRRTFRTWNDYVEDFLATLRAEGAGRDQRG